MPWEEEGEERDGVWGRSRHKCETQKKFLECQRGHEVCACSHHPCVECDAPVAMAARVVCVAIVAARVTAHLCCRVGTRCKATCCLPRTQGSSRISKCEPHSSHTHHLSMPHTRTTALAMRACWCVRCCAVCCGAILPAVARCGRMRCGSSACASLR
jgi:hypothetical protein